MSPARKDLLQTISTCYATCSLGAPSDALPVKLNAIAGAHFAAIELAFPDLLTFAHQHLGREVSENDSDALCEAGRAVKTLCMERGLKILMLQPFARFEGWAEGSDERKDAFERARGWAQIMEAVGTDMLQVQQYFPLHLPCHTFQPKRTHP
jgi:sugar phosphate isomerase/epimerase